MQANSLDVYRAEIDQIDRELSALILCRMNIVEKVASFKLEQNMTVLQPEREAQLLEKLTQGLSPQEKEELTTIYRSILAASRSRQQDIIDQANQ